VDPRLSAIFTEEENLVGIERPRDDLTNWMIDEDNSSIKHSKILSIVGFGGRGKTTLANEAYRHIKFHLFRVQGPKDSDPTFLDNGKNSLTFHFREATTQLLQFFAGVQCKIKFEAAKV
jgi:ABC-type glutathione transport system ATPase component